MSIATLVLGLVGAKRIWHTAGAVCNVIESKLDVIDVELRTQRESALHARAQQQIGLAAQFAASNPSGVTLVSPEGIKVTVNTFIDQLKLVDKGWQIIVSSQETQQTQQQSSQPKQKAENTGNSSKDSKESNEELRERVRSFRYL